MQPLPSLCGVAGVDHPKLLQAQDSDVGVTSHVFRKEHRLSSTSMSYRFETSTKGLNNGGIRSRGSSQGPAERINVIIRDLEQDERDMNVMIIAVRLFGCLLQWRGHECSRTLR